MSWPYFASLLSPTPLTASPARLPGRAGDLPQRRVMEDHVGGQAELLRGGPAPRPQLLEQRLVRTAQLRRVRAPRRPCPGPPPRPVRRLRLAAQHDLAPPAENIPALRRQHQRAVIPLDGQQSTRQQLTHHAPPLRLAQLLAHAKHGQRGVVEVDHPGRLAAEQDVGDGRRRISGAAPASAAAPRTAASARRSCRPRTAAGPGTCRSCRTRPTSRRSSSAAGTGGSRRSRTARASHPGARPAAPVRQVALGPVDQPPLQDHVLQPVGQPGGRRSARPGRPGRSPGSSPRRTWAGQVAPRSARRACRCPSRTRSWPP